MTSLVGGGVNHDHLQVFRLNSHGFDHLYVQPYDGITPVPGEHHTWMRGSLRSPAIFERRTVRGGKWSAGQDAGLADYLGGDGSLSAITRRVKWDWSAGTTKTKPGAEGHHQPDGGGTEPAEAK